MLSPSFHTSLPPCLQKEVTNDSNEPRNVSGSHHFTLHVIRRKLDLIDRFLKLTRIYTKPSLYFEKSKWWLCSNHLFPVKTKKERMLGHTAFVWLQSYVCLCVCAYLKHSEMPSLTACSWTFISSSRQPPFPTMVPGSLSGLYPLKKVDFKKCFWRTFCV